jgi:peptide/nickel transport system substrate-binding protein
MPVITEARKLRKTVKFLWLAGLLLLLCLPGLLWAGPPPAPYLIGDPQGDWGFPSPFAHNPRGPGYLRASFIFDTLIWKDARGFIPALARSWEYEPQGPAYVFRLHPGVKWHDGQPLTASDVAFTLNYLQRHPVPWVSLAPVQQAEVVDPLTIRIKLAKPYAPFLEEIAGSMFILPRHIWEEVQDPGAFQEPRAVIGSGPYRLAEYRRDLGLYRFAAFAGYYRGRAVVPSLSFVQVGNELIALKGKAVNAGSVPPEAVEQLRALGLSVQDQPHFWCLKLLFNHQRFPMGERAFRLALAQALNLEELIATTLRGHALPGSPGLLPPDSPWYNAKVKPYAYDPAAARRLLASLGFTETPPGLAREGKVLQLELLCSAPYARVAEYLQGALKSLGITLNLRMTDQTVLDQRVRANAFDLALSGHGGLGADPKIIADVTQGRLAAEFLGGYQPPAPLGRLLEEQLYAGNLDRRQQLVAQIQELLAAELPALPLFYPTHYMAHDGSVPWFFTRGGIAKGIPIFFNKIALLTAAPP